MSATSSRDFAPSWVKTVVCSVLSLAPTYLIGLALSRDIDVPGYAYWAAGVVTLAALGCLTCRSPLRDAADFVRSLKDSKPRDPP